MDGTVEALSLNRVKSPSSPERKAGSDAMEYLALYQTAREHALESKECRDGVNMTSELWDDGSRADDVARLSPVNFELVDFVGDKIRDSGEPSPSSRNPLLARIDAGNHPDAPPHLLHCKFTGQHVGRWLRPEHVEAASQLQGYRRTLVYRPHPSAKPKEVDSTTTDLSEDDQHYVVMLHEFDAAGHGKGLEKVKEAVEAIDGSEGFDLAFRAWDLIGSEGFGGKK